MSDQTTLQELRQDHLRRAMETRGVDPETRMWHEGPRLLDMADTFRRIAVLESAPVPAIQWEKRIALKLGLSQEIQDNLWRAYERQIRDETSHGAYWGEVFFLLTGEEYSAQEGDSEAAHGVNAKIGQSAALLPPESDDPQENRRSLFGTAAFSLGLESGFAEHSYPGLLRMIKRCELPLGRTFLPILQQIARDEARHINIGRYAFHVLRESQGEKAEKHYRKIVNAARRAFGVPECSEREFANYLGQAAPPTSKAVLGDHVVLA